LTGRYAEFGKLLRQLRENLALTQDGLKDLLKGQNYEIKSKGTISKWENGNSRPSEGIVEILEDVFGATRGTLLRPAGYPHDIAEVKTTEPIVTKNLEAHFAYLAELANGLIANGLDRIVRIPPRQVGNETFEYVGQDGKYLTREQLSSMFNDNIDEADAKYASRELIDLFKHVASEYPELISKGIKKVIEDNPYELKEVLRALARVKIIKGTCRICKDWL
jgi:transcriptional regulator with XRE-family HTH domain